LQLITTLLLVLGSHRVIFVTFSSISDCFSLCVHIVVSSL